MASWSDSVWEYPLEVVSVVTGIGHLSRYGHNRHYSAEGEDLVTVWLLVPVAIKMQSSAASEQGDLIFFFDS